VPKTFDEHLAERESQNGRKTTRLWTARPHLRGMVGEVELARYFGAAPDFTNKPEGDRGIDRELKLETSSGERWYACDVKASPYGDFLRVDVTKCAPLTIYILCHTFGDKEGALVGWQWGRVVAQAPKTNWCGNGTIVYYIRQRDLRRMITLRARVLDIR
jgi:hypothetical protein